LKEELKQPRNRIIFWTIVIGLPLAFILLIATAIREGDIEGVIIYLMVGAFVLLLIIPVILKLKKDSNIYKKYEYMITDNHITSAEALAEVMGKPIDEVIVVLKRMASSDYFDNVQFDVNTNELVLADGGNDMRCNHCSALL